MLTPRSTLTRRIGAALDATPSRIPVLVGGCGTGRSTVLQQLRDRALRGTTQYIDVERTASTPERFLSAIAAASPFPFTDTAAPGARAAFDAALAFLARARTSSGEPATFLLDEALELRTFESFPGLRQALYELVDSLAAGGNRFVLTSRYSARAIRLLQERSPRFEVIHMPGLTVEDTLDMLGLTAGNLSSGDVNEAEYTAGAVQALSAGRPVYVRAFAVELAAMRDRGGPGSSDALSALVALLAPDGQISRQCNYSYELRLHRARGYGALKAILEILADEESLTLTEISHRLQRTPGSTKDYLSWLEDVDLVAAQHKRYSYTDPLLRVWVRLYCHANAPSEDDVAREVHRYALPRMPQQQESAMAMAAAGGNEDERKDWGIIEID
jgi:hypothetical protein